MTNKKFSILFCAIFLLASISLSSAANFNIRNGSDTSQSFFFVNGTTGQIGIGTSTPSQLLDVRGIINSSGTIYYNNGTLVNSTFFTSMNNTASLQQLLNSSYAFNTTFAIQSLLNDTMLRLSSLNVTGTSYLGNIVLSANNITTSNIIAITNSTNPGNITIGNGTNEWARFTGDGKVGIGTGTPNSKLHVKDSTTGVREIITIEHGTSLNDGGNITWMTTVPLAQISSVTEVSTGDTLTFSTRSSGTFAERMRIDDTGNVGIGTTSPTHLLNVFGNTNLSGNVYLGNNSMMFINGSNVGIGTTLVRAPLEVFTSAGAADTTGGGLIVSRVNDGTDYRGGAIYSRFFTGFSDALVFGVTTANAKNPYSDLDQVRMVIGANGKVGINTTAPSQTLNVVGDLNVTGTSYLGNIILSADNITTNNLIPKNGNITFRNSSDEFARITSQGLFGIGTSAPYDKLTLSGGNLGINTTSGSLKVMGSIANASLMTGARGLYVSGRYAYVTAFTNKSLSIIDISNPNSPVIVGNLISASFGAAHEVFVSGKYAYVDDATGSTFSVVDISDPVNPVRTGGVSSASLTVGNKIYVSGRYAYVASSSNSSLSIIDVSNPSSPSVTGYISSSSNLSGARGVYVQGKYAYVASSTNDSLSIIDVSNPSSPAIISTLSNSLNLDGSFDVYVSGRYAYVASSTNSSLSIVDISNASNPSITATISSSSSLSGAREIYVSGKYAYVAATGNNALTVIDISNSSNPLIAGSVSTPLGSPHAVYVSGRYAYVTNQNGNGLTIVDIGGIDAPAASIGDIQASSIETWNDIDVGNNLYVRNGLSVGSGGISSNGVISFVNNSFTIGTNGFVGIGTTTPSNTLDVRGQGNFSGMIYYNNGTPVSALNISTSGFAKNTTAEFQQSLNNSNMYFSSLGVGIVPTKAGFALDVNGNLTLNRSSENFPSVGGRASSGIWFKNSNGNPTLAMWKAFNNNLVIQQSDSGGTGIILGNSTTAQMTILSAGNANDGFVGIGTTNPNATLTVNGNATIGTLSVGLTNVGIGTTSPRVPLHIDSTSNPAFEISSSVAPIILLNESSAGSSSWVFGVDGNNLFFRRNTTADTDRVTFASSGNVGIGTSTPGATLTVAGNISIGGLSFAGNGASNNITSLDCITFRTGGKICAG